MTATAGADGIVEWLIGDARSLELPAIVESLGLRLNALGLSLDRFGVSFWMLNATMLAGGVLWRPERGIDFIRFNYANRSEGLYDRSPIKTAHDTRATVLLDLAHTPDDAYGIVPDLKEEGLAHYGVIPMWDSSGGRMNLLIATKRAQPFSAEQIAILHRVIPALSLVLEVKNVRSTFRNILSTYVGPGPARQIMDGSVHLGQVTHVRAAILLADLRGFTHLSTRLPPEATADVINRYYDIVVPAVMAHGGEVLKYIGDAVLAIFPAEEGGDEQAALKAMDAARQALDTPVQPFTIVGNPVQIRFGIGLHLGDAVYGNVGSGERLDFTVIGRDVNVAARVATLCSRLGREYLVSDAVAAVGKLHGRQMAEAGSHDVRGLDEPLRVHVPDVSEVGLPTDDGVSTGLALAPD